VRAICPTQKRTQRRATIQSNRLSVVTDTVHCFSGSSLHHSPLHQTTKHLERIGDCVFGIAGVLGD